MGVSIDNFHPLSFFSKRKKRKHFSEQGGRSDKHIAPTQEVLLNRQEKKTASVAVAVFKVTD